MLPRSPIKCVDVIYTPRGSKWAYVLALPFDLFSYVTRNDYLQPLNCHRLASLATTVAPSVVITNHVCEMKLTLIYIRSSYYFLFYPFFVLNRK